MGKIGDLLTPSLTRTCKQVGGGEGEEGMEALGGAVEGR